MGRVENAEVFRHSMELMKKDATLVYATKDSINGQKILLEGDVLDGSSDKYRYNEDAKIMVSKKRSFEASSAYKGMKVCVHNFASATNPGGGVVKGSSAQEESLCRVSNLYPCLNDKDAWSMFYYPHRKEKNPLHNDDIIYTPGVYVFKTDNANPTLMKKEDWFKVDVLTCAAPNLRENPSNAFNSGDGNEQAKVTDVELLEIHKKRLSRICDVAISEGVEVLILGAFGCGAFLNKPEVVARAAFEIMEKYKKAFKVVEFAVYCSPKDQRNYEVFARRFGR